MLELGKVEERLGIDMDLYLSPCKAETGLGSDRLPQELWECTPVEIRSSVVEAEDAVVTTWLHSQAIGRLLD